jgi:pimeloyl-ACP methyl ester carboxylesterase
MHTDPSLQRGYAPVNGLSMYFEVRGQGLPLILLHGGLGMMEAWAALPARLAETRQVIAVELQGHGRTADIDRPFSFEQWADDVAALLDHLGHERADVLGYALGGIVALQVLIRHRARVRGLIVVSAPYHSEGWFAEERAGIAALEPEALLDGALHDAYAAVAPDPSGFAALVRNTRDLLVSGFNFTTDLAALDAAPLIIVADADNMPLAHPLTLFALFGGGVHHTGFGARPEAQLAIIPGSTHFDILSRTELLVPIITRYLDPLEALG